MRPLRDVDSVTTTAVQRFIEARNLRRLRSFSQVFQSPQRRQEQRKVMCARISTELKQFIVWMLLGEFALLDSSQIKVIERSVNTLESTRFEEMANRRAERRLAATLDRRQPAIAMFRRVN